MTSARAGAAVRQILYGSGSHRFGDIAGRPLVMGAEGLQDTVGQEGLPTYVSTHGGRK